MSHSEGAEPRAWKHLFEIAGVQMYGAAEYLKLVTLVTLESQQQAMLVNALVGLSLILNRVCTKSQRMNTIPNQPTSLSAAIQ